jgi:formylglycine-generating enzyme required for sulfatase activity
VTLTQGFHLGIHPVTQAQWQAVMATNPSQCEGGDRPVDNISWKDAQKFCGTLGERTGRRFRLPTEAEWEYACRAGTTTPFFFGDTISTDLANYDGNSVYGHGTVGVHRHASMPAGSFPPNAWGLFDMHGNIMEWCQDRWGPYQAGDLADPRGAKSGWGRVVRGG